MVDKLQITKRLQADGRWGEVEPVKNQMIKEARAAGMTKEDSQAWAYSEIDRLYPPLQSVPADPPSAPDSLTASTSGRLVGLHAIPADWGTLPLNASLQAELGWVQGNRLSVVEELPSGATRVHLERARAPAPSLAALGWLETSIRVYSKYVDVVARSLKDEADEVENVRRERMRLDEITGLLQEMEEESDRQLLADVPSGIRERARSCLDEWVRRSKSILNRMLGSISRPTSSTSCTGVRQRLPTLLTRKM
jgi:hypothetical protein